MLQKRPEDFFPDLDMSHLNYQDTTSIIRNVTFTLYLFYDREILEHLSGLRMEFSLTSPGFLLTGVSRVNECSPPKLLEL